MKIDFREIAYQYLMSYPHLLDRLDLLTELLRDAYKKGFYVGRSHGYSQALKDINGSPEQ